MHRFSGSYDIPGTTYMGLSGIKSPQKWYTAPGVVIIEDCL